MNRRDLIAQLCEPLAESDSDRDVLATALIELSDTLNVLNVALSCDVELECETLDRFAANLAARARIVAEVIGR